MARKSHARWPLLVAAALLCGAVYLPSLRYDFVWDDEQLIAANPALADPVPLRLFGQSFLSSGHGSESRRVRYYRPLTSLSCWLDYRLWGQNPLGFHLTNVLLNTLVLLLLAAFLLRVFGRPAPGAPDPLWPALLGVLAFGLHPSHIESVAFVSGRTDLLAALFILLAALALNRDGSIFFPFLAAAAFGLALLAKEVAILFPLVALVLLRWSPAARRRSLLSLALLLATAAAWLLARSLVLGSALPALSGSAAQRLLLFLNALGRYGAHAVFPFSHHLLYPDAAAFARIGWPTATGIGLAAVLVWTTWCWRSSAPGIGAAWFLAFILPACNLFPLGTSFLAERLLYLPSAGAILLLFAAGAKLKPVRLRAALAWLLVGYSVVMGFGTLHRMPVWRDNLSLFRTAVREAPSSADAHLNFGAALLKSGDSVAAEREFRQALALRPGEPVAHNNLGDVLRKRGLLVEAEEHFRDAIALDPGYAEAHGNLGIVHALAGRNDSALREFSLARELKPGLVAAHINLGNVFVALGKPDSAVASFWTAIRLEPGRTEPYVNLSRLYTLLGKPDSAELVGRLLDRRP